MNEFVKSILDDTKENMSKALEHLSIELSKLRAGKATPSMMDGIYVEYYGSTVPLNQVANVNTPDARTLVVQPWEKTILRDIERAIINSNLGYNPQNDGEIIIINIPPLTEERRINLVKSVKVEAENGKIAIRNLRRDGNAEIKKLEKDGISEDAAKDGEGEVQKITDDYIKRIDDVVTHKEKEIMTV
ncbi:MAG: ribosome recycling factor [Bacteroidia bacterium]|jgi:ribosome recycling factor